MTRLTPLLALLCSAPALVAQADIRAVSFAGTAYSINSTTGTGAMIGPSGVTNLNSMAAFGNLLVCVSNTGMLVSINPITGAGTPIVATSPALTDVRGLAATPFGVLYAIRNGSPMDLLYTIDVATGATTLIGPTSHPGLQGLASDLIGTLYAWDVGPGTGVGVGLVTVDPVTGASTDVNPSVGNPVDVQCLATSPAGLLYGSRSNLYLFDVTTGVATLIGGGGYTDVRGMEFVPAAGCTQFNGTGINPLVCNCSTLPVLGTTWTISVNPSSTTVLTLVFVSTIQLPFPFPLFGGEALIAPPVADIGAGLGTHSLVLPPDPQFSGLALFMQGLRLEALPAGLTIELTNGVVGVLGF
ncbi:MAG TPA: hypothetical protein VF384_18765 [Planctomycetota bacterium]